MSFWWRRWTEQSRSPSVATECGEWRVFGEKAVSGMDRVDPEQLRGADDAGDVEIAVPRGRRADAEGLIGQARVQRSPVGLGVHGGGPHPQLAAGPDHPD